MAREVLNMRTTNLIQLVDLKDRLTGTLPEDATVEADLLTSAGAAVSGGADLPCTWYEAGAIDLEEGYYGRVPSTVTLTENAEYIVRVVATWNDGTEDIVRTFDIDCVAKRR